MKVSVNLSGVGQVVPEGLYSAAVSEVRLHKKDTVSPPTYSLRWTFVLTDETDFKGETLTDFTSLQPNALWRLYDRLEVLGLVKTVLNDTGELDLTVDDETGIVTQPTLSGVPCLISVSHEIYEGRERARIDDVLPAKTQSIKKKKHAGTVVRRAVDSSEGTSTDPDPDQETESPAPEAQVPEVPSSEAQSVTPPWDEPPVENQNTNSVGIIFK